MRKVLAGSVVALVAATALTAPTLAHAQTIGVFGPCVAAGPGNTITLTGNLTTLQSLPSGGGYTKQQAYQCPAASVSTNPLNESAGLAQLGGPYGLAGFGGDCLLAVGPFPENAVGAIQVFIGDTVDIGVGDFSEELNILTPQSPAQLPCMGTAANNYTETFNFTGTFQFLPPQVP